jgi:hypothetical protein
MAENGIGAASGSIGSHGMSGPTTVVSMAMGPWLERERRERDES